MTKLYLVRHGETVDNKAQIMQGQTPGKLNMKGIEQAEEVARKMAGTPIDVFVSSDLYRSIQTCEIIAGSHPVVTTPLLRERDWGDFTGKFIPEGPKGLAGQHRDAGKDEIKSPEFPYLDQGYLS